MRFVLGALAIGFGVYYLFTSRSAAAGGAEFHRKLHRVAPWLYPKPLRMALSERNWRPLAFVAAMGLIVVGILFIVVTPR